MSLRVDTPTAVLIPVSEQAMVLEYLMDSIKSSGLQANLPININRLEANTDSLAVNLLKGSARTSNYIDGSYSASIPFMLVRRRLGIPDDTNVYKDIELINKIGNYLMKLDGYISEETRLYVDSVEQTTFTGLIYRGTDGVEDNGATFVINYTHSKRNRRRQNG